MYCESKLAILEPGSVLMEFVTYGVDCLVFLEDESQVLSQVSCPKLPAVREFYA
jgi:hypothetical protein